MALQAYSGLRRIPDTKPRQRRRFLPAFELLEERSLLSNHIVQGDLIVPDFCDERTPPRIDEVQVTTPAPGEILTHGRIHYVTGNAVDVALTMPSCMAVTDILANDFSLVQAEKDGDGIEHPTNWYDLMSDEPLPSGRRVTYRLYITNETEGFSADYRFVVENSLQRLAANESGQSDREFARPTVEYDFTLVEALEVSTNDFPSVSLSEAEVRNSFMVGLFRNYGDEGRYVKLDDEGSVSSITYDPSYEDLELEITAGLIHFGYSVKYSLDGYCDPKARVEGDFELLFADGQLLPVWREGPFVTSLDFSDEDLESLYCDVPAQIVNGLVQGLTLLTWDLGFVVTLFIQDRITDEVLDQVNDTVDGQVFIADGPLGLYEDEIRVPLNFQLPAVTIQVPYNIENVEEPWSKGVALNAKDSVLVTAQGLVHAARENNAYPPTDTVPISSAGLFNLDKNVPAPLPDYWFESNGQKILLEERLEAYSALTKLQRYYVDLGTIHPATLPLPSVFNVGALMNRLGYAPGFGGTLQHVEPGQIVFLEYGPGRLAFSNNDIGPQIGEDRFDVGPVTYGFGAQRVTLSWIAQGNVNFLTGELTITLHDDNDEVGIYSTDTGLGVTINGVTSLYPHQVVRTVRLATGGGDDRITIGEMPAHVVVRLDAGDGTDVVQHTSPSSLWFVATGVEGCVPSVFTVTTTADSGPGSLRQAILDSNTNCGVDTIAFNISGPGVHTIQPLSALPAITDPVAIDGYTQPGAAPNTLALGNDAVLQVELDGSLAGAGTRGLTITADNTTVRGLVVNRFDGWGILVQSSANCRIQGSFLGTDVSGTVALGNLDGIVLFSTSANLVGGSEPADRNLVSGNHRIGINLTQDQSSLVRGNYVGTDRGGQAGLGNALHGVVVQGDSARTLIQQNLVSANAVDGVIVGGPTADGVLVKGNVIGLNAAGNTMLGNAGYGITFAGMNGVIGGTSETDRNVISGNGGGIRLLGEGHQILGNFIGTDRTGTVALGNNGVGILADGFASTSRNHTIGGAGEAGNVISGNASDGIFLAGGSARDNRILGNFIGTDVTGTVALGNTRGITLNSAPNNTIGGERAGNLISGNQYEGIFMIGAGASNNIVSDNVIGLDATGTVDLGNGGTGVWVEGSNNLIGVSPAGGGNVISGNERAGVFIQLASATGNQVLGNRIGTDAAGTRAIGNTDYGVFLFNAAGNFVGGPNARDRNVIAGSGTGVLMIGPGATGNVIENNYVGTDVGGTTALGNTYGFLIENGPANNTLHRNLISGNYYGVRLAGTGTVNNRLTGNLIGTDVTGTRALGNVHGVQVLDGANHNVVGEPRTRLGPSNVISGNSLHGVTIGGAGADSNLVQGNFVGLDVTGNATLGNGAAGVRIDGASGNLLGGTGIGEGNVISGNGGNGVEILGTGAADNDVWGNLIGTDVTGTVRRGNAGNGVRIAGGAHHNWVGGSLVHGGPGVRNIISANHQNGVEIADTATAFNHVESNYIGTDLSGSLPLGNLGDGLLIQDARQNFVAGYYLQPGFVSIISANHGDGIEIRGVSAIDNRVSGTFIGTDYRGASSPGVDLGNWDNGILINGAVVSKVVSNLNAPGVISGNHDNGIEIRGSEAFATVVANYRIGTTLSGTVPLGNQDSGILIDGATHTHVFDNTISANGVIEPTSVGVLIRGASATGNLLWRNLIGTDAWGIGLVGYQSTGVRITEEAFGNWVGDGSSVGNVIAGAGVGVHLTLGVTGNFVQGNYIGTDAMGAHSRGNTIGVAIDVAANDNLIGGTRRAEGNLISGNAYGVRITAADGNRILGNLIGTDAGGATPLGNTVDGISLHLGSSNNQIGGLENGADNKIAFNGRYGVWIEYPASTGNAILSNSIDANGNLGINLGIDGVTPNDGGGDPDSGPNNLQNYPVINLAARDPDTGAVILRGVLNSLPNRTFAIQIFSVPACDPSGHGEGRTLRATLTRTTNAGGTTGSFEVTVNEPANAHLTATATLMVDHDGNPSTPLVPRDTSEFSACRKIVGPRPHPPNAGPSPPPVGGTSYWISSPATGNAIGLDASAADSGRFVDGTLIASNRSGQKRVDLLTVLEHERVHVPGDMRAETRTAGTPRAVRRAGNSDKLELAVDALFALFPAEGWNGRDRRELVWP